MNTYSNRFASMVKLQQPQSYGSWVVINEVTGLPVYIDPEADYPQERIYPDYNSARAAMNEITEHYKTLA